MKRGLILLLAVFMLGIWFGCEEEPQAYSVSVDQVEAGDLTDFSGSGSLPADSAEALQASAACIQATVQSMDSAMGETEMPLMSIAGLTPSPSIEGDNTVNPETGEISGYLDIIDEDLLDDFDNVIGNVSEMHVEYSVLVDGTENSMEEEITGSLDAALTLEDFDFDGATINDASVNAAAQAEINVNMVVDEEGEPESGNINYNIGAAVSAGYTLSSDVYVGKFIITCSYSAIDSLTIDMASETPDIPDLDITIIVEVYDNDDVLVEEYSYNMDDIAMFMESEL